MTDQISPEIVQYCGQKFIELKPDFIELEAMAAVQKVKDVFAWQVPDDETHTVTTYSHGMVETVNIANGGDWVVYNIGNSQGITLESKLRECDQKVIKQTAFEKLYQLKSKDEDAEDDTEKRGTLYEYIGAPIRIAQVPFPFFIDAPWGERQYIHKGGYITYNPNTKEWYGTAGARNRKAGQLENTYTLVDDDPRTISKAFRMVIASDRSVLPGVQFSMADVARAYETAGKELNHQLQRYT